MEEHRSKNSLVRVGDKSITRYSNALVRRALVEIATKASLLNQADTPSIRAKGKIIVVGRDDGWVPCFSTELRRRGYDTTTVETFDKLREFLSVSVFDMVIPTNSDYSKGEGMEKLVSELKRQYPSLKIIVMSGYADLKIAIDYARRGVDDFISLPFDSADVIETIDRVFHPGDKDIKDAHILVVDDEPALAECIQLELLREGYKNIHVAFDGDEAITMLTKFSEEILVVILGLHMPKVSGFEVMKCLAGISKHVIGIIMLTGDDRKEIYWEFKRLGTEKVIAFDFISKPYDWDYLFNRIKEAIIFIQSKRKQMNKLRNN